MTQTEAIYIMCQRVRLMHNALAHGHIHEAAEQLGRIQGLCERVLYGVTTSKPDVPKGHDYGMQLFGNDGTITNIG